MYPSVPSSAVYNSQDKGAECPPAIKDAERIHSGMLAIKNDIVSFPATWVGPRDYHTKSDGESNYF